MTQKSKVQLWGIGISMLIMHATQASVGCLHNSYDLSKPVDYKAWHSVEDCSCPCEKWYSFAPGGLCNGCKHRHTDIPLNAQRNVSNGQNVVKAVNLARLQTAKRRVTRE